VAKIKEKKSEPTKVSTKHECSIVANGLQPYAVRAFNHCTNLEAQNYE